MRKSVLAVATLGLVAAACGQPTPSGASSTTGPEPTTSSPSTSQAPSGDVLPTCYEAPLPAAEPSFYRDTPKYVGNEMPVDAVREWASQYSEFADIWIDREHNGWVAVGFTDNVAERQVEIEALFPDEGVVAVHLDWTAAELEELHTRVRAELSGVVELQGSSVDTLRGYVNLIVPVRSEETLGTIVELFPDEPICVEGLEPEDVVPPGPQPQAGDGWRLLLDQDEVGDVYRTGIAWDQQSLATLHAGIPGLVDVDLDVDLENEVVIWFGAVHGSSCPNLRLDEVVVDGDTVSAAIVNTDNAIACTDDAIPHTYLVALARDRLPAPPFYLTLDERGFGDRLRVDADLREIGSVAAPGEVSSDPKTQEPEGSGVIIETGFPWEYTVDLTCGFEALGEINDYQWVAAEAIPEAWLEAAGDAPSVVVEVLLHEGPEPYLEVTHGDVTVRYEPADDPGCTTD